MLAFPAGLAHTKGMDDLRKEQILHKVIAASAFLFALCILPVAQYFLVSNQLPDKSASTTTKEVASTPNPEEKVMGNVPAEELNSVSSQPVTKGQACLQQKERELSDLERWVNGKKNALWRSYEQNISPYKQAMDQIEGDPEKVASEKAALQSLIDQEYEDYLKKLSEVEAAVDSQKQSIQSRSCSL